ncbi:MAG: tellurite resistance TerB family protein [Bdellovibrio bacteriovorus]
MNPFDILGAVMQSGMSPSSGARMGDALGKMMGSVMGGGAPGGGPAGMQSGAPGGGMFDIFSKVAGSMMGGGQGGAPGAGGGLPADILKQVAGAVLGGGAPGGNAAAGAGSLAVFGTLAAQALEMAKSMMGGGQSPAGMPKVRMDDQTAVLAGMRAPQTPQERQQLTDVALLTLQAMLTAAKADGRLDEREKERILGKMQEGGISSEEQRFVNEEIQKPIDIDALVRAVPNQQVAAQIYAASLMAIEVDTDGERRYLADLASKLGLDPNAVAFLHRSMGLA